MNDKEKKCCEKNPNECHCAFRCLGGEFCDEAEKRIKTLQEKLDIVVKALDRINREDYMGLYGDIAEEALAKIKEIK